MPVSVTPAGRPVIARMSLMRSGRLELNRISWFWSVVANSTRPEDGASS